MSDPCTYDCYVAEPHDRRALDGCVWTGVPDSVLVDGIALRVTDPRLYRLGPLPRRPEAFVRLDERRLFGDADLLEEGVALYAAAQHRDPWPGDAYTTEPPTPAAPEEDPVPRSGSRDMRLDDVAPALLDALRALGAEYGPTGVARVAAQLVTDDAVRNSRIRDYPPPPPMHPKDADDLERATREAPQSPRSGSRDMRTVWHAHVDSYPPPDPPERRDRCTVCGLVRAAYVHNTSTPS